MNTIIAAAIMAAIFMSLNGPVGEILTNIGLSAIVLMSGV